MNRLQRYIFRELAAAFVLLLAIVTAVVGAVLLLQFLHKAPDIGLFALVRALPYVLPEAFPITVPISFLVACLLAYGRFADDNEFTALRMGGIHPWQAVAPAVLLGVILSIGTLWLNTDVLPWATLGKKEIARDQIAKLIRALEEGDATSVPIGKRFSMSAAGRGDDGSFVDVQITYRAAEDKEPDKDDAGGAFADSSFQIEAERAYLSLSNDGDTLVLDLSDARVRREDTTITYGRQELAIDLDLLLDVSPRKELKRASLMSAEELRYRLARGSLSKELMRDWNAEFWRRIALGFAPLAFALLGAPLGLRNARGSRAAAFVMAIIIALPVYYPLLRLGHNLAAEGVLPAPVALLSSNALLAAAGGIVMWKVVRV